MGEANPYADALFPQENGDASLPELRGKAMNVKLDEKHTGKNIKGYRKQRGWTKAELAERAGIMRELVGQYESSGRMVISTPSSGSPTPWACIPTGCWHGNRRTK